MHRKGWNNRWSMVSVPVCLPPDGKGFPAESGAEPCLADMLRDPIVLAVMARDGLSPDQVAGVIDEARARLRSA